jgi:hypothetical protein
LTNDTLLWGLCNTGISFPMNHDELSRPSRRLAIIRRSCVPSK